MATLRFVQADGYLVNVKADEVEEGTAAIFVSLLNGDEHIIIAGDGTNQLVYRIEDGVLYIVLAGDEVVSAIRAYGSWVLVQDSIVKARRPARMVTMK